VQYRSVAQHDRLLRLVEDRAPPLGETIALVMRTWPSATTSLILSASVPAGITAARAGAAPRRAASRS